MSSSSSSSASSSSRVDQLKSDAYHALVTPSSLLVYSLSYGVSPARTRVRLIKALADIPSNK
jgi:hypothetical protein